MAAHSWKRLATFLRFDLYEVIIERSHDVRLVSSCIVFSRLRPNRVFTRWKHRSVVEEAARMIRFFFALTMAVAIAGCGDPSIDASSDESLQTSIAHVRGSLPESKHEEFDKAVMAVSFGQMEVSDLFGAAASPALMESRMKQSLDGKTAEQVFARAEQVRLEREQVRLEREARDKKNAIEREAREREQALAEIDELEEKRNQSDAARENLRRFEVLRSRFYKQERQFGRDEPVIDISVRNGTEHAVSRAYFEGTIASPGRSVPWLKDTFNYEISGGIEPGEEASWSLAPNMFSDWGTVDAPADAVFTVTVLRVDDPGGDAIFDSRGLSAHDEKRLAELKSKHSQP